MPPSGTGCVECEATGGWWFHLRRCAQCGHIGLLRLLAEPARPRHAATAGHPVVRSFEPGEDWFWDFSSEQPVAGPELAPPQHHPVDQPAPGPARARPRRLAAHLH